MKLVTILLVFVSFSTKVYSEDLLVEGIFETEGESYFVDNKFTVTPWANQFLVSAKVSYGGYPLDVSVLLESQSDGVYKGKGTITASYGPFKKCHFDYGILLEVVGDEVFLKSYAPSFVPSTIGATQACSQIQVHHRWFVHPGAYQET